MSEPKVTQAQLAAPRSRCGRKGEVMDRLVLLLAFVPPALVIAAIIWISLTYATAPRGQDEGE